MHDCLARPLERLERIIENTLDCFDVATTRLPWNGLLADVR
jgi:hypothetical protein